MSTWILLRGLTRESRHWGEFPALFQREMRGVNVIALDLPGNGSLHALPSSRSVEVMAEYCREELCRRGMTPPFNVLAMSLGAMVTVAWATQYPAEIAACVLINTSMRPLNPFYQRLLPHNYPALFKLALFGGSARDWEATILRITSQRAEENADVLPRWIEYRRQFPVTRANAMRQLWAAAGYRVPAIQPPVRMLILASQRDQLVDSRCSQTLAACWQLPMLVHPSAGHDIALDDGPWVARQIGNWIQSLEQQLR